jgi:hypothetical protein
LLKFGYQVVTGLTRFFFFTDLPAQQTFSVFEFGDFNPHVVHI